MKFVIIIVDDLDCKCKDTDDISPYPTVVMVTTAHQKPSGIDLK